MGNPTPQRHGESLSRLQEAMYVGIEEGIANLREIQFVAGGIKTLVHVALNTEREPSTEPLLDAVDRFILYSGPGIFGMIESGIGQHTRTISECFDELRRTAEAVKP